MAFSRVGHFGLFGASPVYLDDRFINSPPVASPSGGPVGIMS
jgi:hypothetical protein